MRPVLLAMVPFLISSPSFAADFTDLTGKWSGTSRSVVANKSENDDAGTTNYRLAEEKLNIEWLQQDKGRLIGTLTYHGHSIPKFGVISSDGTTIVTTDTSGSSVGRIIDENNFELCYTQTFLERQPIVASCVDFVRDE